MSPRSKVRPDSWAPHARAGRRPGRPADQRGYALLMVVFVAAVMVIVAAAATLSVITEGKRAREEEAIWRGEQYERAIGLYYRKNARFPTSVDDLVKGNNGVRFLRQAYKDPMNKTDGAWRFIYVTAAGQLVGSLRYTSLAQMAAAQKAGQGTAVAGATPAGALSDDSGSGNQQQQGSPPGANPQGAPPGTSPAPQNPITGLQGGQPSTPPSAGGLGLAASGEQPQALGTSGGVFGGNIVGVGSTVDKPSLKVYQGGKKYKEWEFIWNPLVAVTIAPAQGGVPGQPGQGTNPNPSPFGNPTQNPTPNPPTPPTPQNPPM